MLNELLVKRKEFAQTLESLKSAREAEIEAKVLAYRKSLEAQISSEAITKVQNVLIAMDELIAYEQAKHTTAYRNVDSEQVVHTESSARPGMSSIVSPR